LISYIVGMQICGQEFSSETIERIIKFIAERPDVSRTELSLHVCEWLDWKSPNGKCKEMSCRMALLKLEKEGLVQLPVGGQSPPKARRDTEANDLGLEPIPEICCSLPELGKVELIPIENRRSGQAHIWNRLMNAYHYLGARPLCGAQIRYLIVSENYGYLGGLSFSAAAWKLQARDQWIGWDDEARQAHLHQVICNSRFLILPQVEVANLASRVLSLAAKRVSYDWQIRYNIEPVLLETFVDRDRFKGSCYRAANWRHVGTTKGRGRNHCHGDDNVSVKDIYLLPLCEDFREILCDGRLPVKKEDTSPVDWVEEEFGDADLGDVRRTGRLLTITRDFYERPDANIPQACQSRARTKAVYKFLDNSNNSMEAILKPHYEKTIIRAKAEKIVLVPNDTTFLNYSSHPDTEGLGPIGGQKEGAVGLLVHDTMAFTLPGTPLGLLDVQCWTRDPEEFGKREKRNQLPIEQKESYKWLKSFSAIYQAQQQCPNTLFVQIGDRESDIYDLFALAEKSEKSHHLLVRAERDRLLEDGQKHLWPYVASLPLSGIQTVNIPRKKKQRERTANLEIRFAQVVLKPPQGSPKLGQVTIWAILAEEKDAPAGCEPVKWMLLTTIPTHTFEDACEKINWYCRRWDIEVYHKVLKSCCKVEDRQLGSKERIETCLAIDMVVGWQIHYITKIGRERPDVPCTVIFEEEEWKALSAYITRKTPPEKPPTLNEFTRMVASLGGFLGRKSDGHPGIITLYRGLMRLRDISAAYKIFMMLHPPNPPPVSSRK
jgi:hypothetical protein